MSLCDISHIFDRWIVNPAGPHTCFKYRSVTLRLTYRSFVDGAWGHYLMRSRGALAGWVIDPTEVVRVSDLVRGTRSE